MLTIPFLELDLGAYTAKNHARSHEGPNLGGGHLSTHQITTHNQWHLLVHNIFEATYYDHASQRDCVCVISPRRARRKHTRLNRLPACLPAHDCLPACLPAHDCLPACLCHACSHEQTRDGFETTLQVRGEVWGEVGREHVRMASVSVQSCFLV